MADADIPNPTEPKPGLPMVIEPQRPRPSLARNATTATFVSHLLAAHQKPAKERPAQVGGALGAYSEGAKVSTRRMPQGYRKTVIA